MAILEPLCSEGEEVVAFDPTMIGASELLNDARCIACAYMETTHVIALVRHGSLVSGRTAFRRYDNDSDARRRGTYEFITARRLWRPCDMYAITAKGSALEQAAKKTPLARTQGKEARREMVRQQLARSGGHTAVDLR